MAGTATLMALKASSEARSAEDRMVSDRNRAILVLIVDHLAKSGYTEVSRVRVVPATEISHISCRRVEGWPPGVAAADSQTAASLQREGGNPLSRFEAADNMDLTTIVREFEAFYEIKLGKKPKLVRRGNGDDLPAKETSSRRHKPRPPAGSSSSSGSSSSGGGGSGGKGSGNCTNLTGGFHARCLPPHGVGCAWA